MWITKIRGTNGWARSIAVMLAALAGLIGSRNASADSVYSFTLLGPSDLNIPVAINNSNEVVGTAGGQAVYANGGPPLAVLGGSNAPASSSAAAVNDGGIVVGSYTPTGGNSGGNPTGFYSTGTPQTATLNGLPTSYGGAAGGAVTNSANAVNGNGTNFSVVGGATYTGGEARAFEWTSGSNTLTALDPVDPVTGAPTNTGLGGGLFGYSVANGINSAGLIVGQATNSNGVATGFLYVPSQSKMYDLGSLGNTTDGTGDSNALAINNLGEIVGATDDVIDGIDYDPRAFIIKSGYTIPAATGSVDQSLFSGATGMIDIGTLEGDAYSTATAVNASGVVVGWSGNDAQGNDSHAFVYNSSAATPSMVDLNSFASGGWTLTSATGINDAGDITGYATNEAGQTEAYILAPTTTTAVPDPAIGMGLLVLLSLIAVFQKIGAKKRSACVVS